MGIIVTHLVIGLGKGGAETMLYQLLLHRVNPSLKYRVISLGEGNYYEPLIHELGIEVFVLPLRKHPIFSFFKLLYLIRGSDMLCCWMYHANFIGYIAGKIVRCKRIIWNIRHSELGDNFNKKSTLRINRWCARRSRNVSCIAYNGNKSKKVHEAIGYFPSNGVVLTNGVDTDEYNPVVNARITICEELGISNDKKIILSVTKYHPIKDVPTFIKAFVDVHTKMPETIAVMCGNGIDCNNIELINLCDSSGLVIGRDIFLLGLRHDMPMLFSSCDLYVLHSVGEAFPNTLVQAMSCSCLCITTDVGDSREIINTPECVVCPQRSEELAEIIEKSLRLSPGKMKKQRVSNRKRVLSQYRLEMVVQKYENLYCN